MKNSVTVTTREMIMNLKKIHKMKYVTGPRRGFSRGFICTKVFLSEGAWSICYNRYTILFSVRADY